MLITIGDARALRGKQWVGIELVSESRTEEIVLHITRWAKKATITPFQLLFPVKSRDLDGVSMISPYLWARSLNLPQLSAMTSVMGVKGLVGADRQVITVDDTFVQTVIEEAKTRARDWSVGIKPGSFVRVLYGDERMLCGIISRMSKDTATVHVKLRTRDLFIDAPVRSLLNLSHIDKRNHCYYYTGGENE